MFTHPQALGTEARSQSDIHRVPARPVSQMIRRRASLAQGRALEKLGHAVEYLVDSRMFHPGAVNQRDEQEAVQILMRASRAVFAECAEVISMKQRVREWMEMRQVARSRH